jgi:hypothetical protein
MGEKQSFESGENQDESRATPEGIVRALDGLVTPLDKILKLFQRAAKFGHALLVVLVLLTLGHLHAIWKLDVLENRMSELVQRSEAAREAATQAKLTAEDTNQKVTSVEKKSENEPSFTVQASTDSSGKPTAVLVIKPSSDKVTHDAAASNAIVLPVPLPSTARVVKDGGPWNADGGAPKQE